MRRRSGMGMSAWEEGWAVPSASPSVEDNLRIIAFLRPRGAGEVRVPSIVGAAMRPITALSMVVGQLPAVQAARGTAVRDGEVPQVGEMMASVSCGLAR